MNAMGATDDNGDLFPGQILRHPDGVSNVRITHPTADSTILHVFCAACKKVMNEATSDKHCRFGNSNTCKEHPAWARAVAPPIVNPPAIGTVGATVAATVAAVTAIGLHSSGDLDSDLGGDGVVGDLMDSEGKNNQLSKSNNKRSSTKDSKKPLVQKRTATKKKCSDPPSAPLNPSNERPPRRACVNQKSAHHSDFIPH